MTVEVSPYLSGRLWPGKKLGDYVVQKRLSQGGYGAVYLATNSKLEGAQVVVKVMHAPGAAHRELLRKEAKQLVTLRHPSLVQVITYGEDEELQYVVMEYLDAPTLATVHKTEGGFGLFETVRIGARMAEALEAVHDVGLVHRDLKPDNIMLKLSRDRGRYVDWLKLIDFGLAHQAGRAGAERAGTAPYVAPETIDPDIGPVAPQTDLYSMGCILFQMMTDQTPWVGDTDEMLEGHLNGRIRRLSEVIRDANPEMEELVYWLMQKNPKARPASATEVVKALLKIEQKLVASETNIFRLSQAFSDTKRLPAKAKATAIEPAPETSESLGTADTNRWADSTNTNPMGGRSAVTMEVTGESRTEHSVPALHDAGAQKSRALLWVGLGALAVVAVGAVLMLRSGTETPVGDTLPEAAVLGSSDASAPGLEHRPEVAVKPPPPVAAVSDAGAPSKVEGPKPEAVKVETRVVTPPVTPVETNGPRPTRVKDPAAPVKLCATNLDAFKAEVLRQRSQPGCMGACADAFDDLADEARPGASLEDLCSKLKALKRAK